jgi:hypothetical protein
MGLLRLRCRLLRLRSGSGQQFVEQSRNALQKDFPALCSCFIRSAPGGVIQDPSIYCFNRVAKFCDRVGDNALALIMAAARKA